MDRRSGIIRAKISASIFAMTAIRNFSWYLQCGALNMRFSIAYENIYLHHTNNLRRLIKTSRRCGAPQTDDFICGEV
jgi:hypothetical protein